MRRTRYCERQPCNDTVMSVVETAEVNMAVRCVTQGFENVAGKWYFQGAASQCRPTRKESNKLITLQKH
jgi:hypothetical protein